MDNSPPTPPEAPEEAEPQITELPVETPKRTRVSRELKNLKSDLDGPSWECTTDHGRRLRVRRVGLEEECNDSWNNVILLDEEEETRNQEEPMEQRD